MKKSSAAILSFSLVVALIRPVSAAGGNRAITVDADNITGVIHSLQGYHRDPGPKGSARSNQYIALGVDTVRTHDAVMFGGGVGDVDGNGSFVMFPDMTKDPNDPTSYNFGPTDALIRNILDTGATVYFRYGRSADNTPAIPADPTEFEAFLKKHAAIASHVVMHYNKGWAQGFRNTLKYFEVWNEPDLSLFWQGTPEQYREFYARIASAAKKADPGLRVGGPVNATFNDFTGLEGTFLQYVQDNRLPLDFYSFHCYTNFSQDPLDYARYAQRFRDLLDEYGFYDTPVINSEWGAGFIDSQLSDAALAAFTADAYIYMQDAPLTKSYNYFPMEKDDGSPNKQGMAFEAIASLNKTPLRVTTTGGDTAGLGVMAGRDLKELRIVISNYEIDPSLMGPYPFPDNTVSWPGVGTFTYIDRQSVTYQNNNGYDLTIRDIPASWRDVTIERYRIDATSDLTLISSSTVHPKCKAPLTLSATMPAPAVELIVVKSAR